MQLLIGFEWTIFPYHTPGVWEVLILLFVVAGSQLRFGLGAGVSEH
jgi:hypothetical protein